jgi:hypothetical protein
MPASRFGWDYMNLRGQGQDVNFCPCVLFPFSVYPGPAFDWSLGVCSIRRRKKFILEIAARKFGLDDIAHMMSKEKNERMSSNKAFRFKDQPLWLIAPFRI